MLEDFYAPSSAPVQDNPLSAYIQTPKDQQQKAQAEALIAALRGTGGVGRSTVGAADSTAQAGHVTPANATGSALSGFANGLSMGKGFGNLNLGTALNYGTRPGSQQTSMLAAQDAGF